MTLTAIAAILAALSAGILLGHKFTKANHTINTLLADDDRGHQVCDQADMAIDGDHRFPPE